MKNKKSFSLLEKALRSGLDSPLNRWFNKACNPRIPSFASAHSSAAWFLPFNGYRNRQSRLACTLGQKSAFSLAEATITLAVLGVIFAIIVPSIYTRHTENVRRTKLKKAVEVYSNAVVTMSSENNFHGSTDKMDSWGSANGCANVRSYFKIVQDGGTHCQFRTSDGVWWSFGPDKDGNLSGRLSKALVSFNKSDLTKAKAVDEITNDAFYLMTQFDEKQKARILDVAYSNYIGFSANIINNAKVYAFINKKKLTDYYNFCGNCDSENGGCKSCVHRNDEVCKNKKGACQLFYYNPDGKQLTYRGNCASDYIGCDGGYGDIPTVYTDRFKELNPDCSLGGNCDVQGSDCNYYVSCPNNNKSAFSETPDFAKVKINGIETNVYENFYLTNAYTKYTSCPIDTISQSQCTGETYTTLKYYKKPRDGTWMSV